MQKKAKKNEDFFGLYLSALRARFSKNHASALKNEFSFLVHYDNTGIIYNGIYRIHTVRLLQGT